MNKVPSLPIINNINIFRRKDEPTQHFNCHQQHILWICLSAESTLIVSECTLSLREGEAMMTFPGQPHMRFCSKNKPSEWLLIRFHAENTGALEIFRNSRIHLSSQSIETVERMLVSWKKQDRESANELAAQMLNLLFQLKGELVKQNIYDPLPDGNVYVRELCELMMKEPPEKDPFGIVSKRWSVTPEYLRVVFRRYLGYPARIFIRNRKNALAFHLLKSSSLSISAIARRIGFKSVYAFSRFFKECNLVSPSAYRNEGRNGKHEL